MATRKLLTLTITTDLRVGSLVTDQQRVVQHLADLAKVIANPHFNKGPGGALTVREQKISSRWNFGP